MSQHKTNTTRHLVAIAMYAVAFILPLTNIPQILTLFSTHVTSGLSLQTWVMYLIFGIVPLFYAYENRIVPLFISNALWVVVEVVMIAGILRFGVLASNDTYQNLLLINTIGKAMAGLGIICLSSAAALFAHDLWKIKTR